MTVKIFFIYSEKLVQVISEMNEGFIPDGNSNVIIGVFVTMYGRMKLYELLDQFKERVFYMDTDSVVLHVPAGADEPETGSYLGQLSSEISEKEGGYIKEFVASGPKSYAYRTASDHQVCKIKGFTINSSTSGELNFNELKQMVVYDNDMTKTVTMPGKITRDTNQSIIYNRPMQKVYKFNYTKRVIKDHFTTVPYGKRPHK